MVTRATRATGEKSRSIEVKKKRVEEPRHQKRAAYTSVDVSATRLFSPTATSTTEPTPLQKLQQQLYQQTISASQDKKELERPMSTNERLR